MQMESSEKIALIWWIVYLCLCFLYNCNNAADKDLDSLVLLLFYITAVRHNAHFEFDSAVIQTISYSLSLIIPHLLHTLLTPPPATTRLIPSLFPKRKLMILSLWKSTGIQAMLCSLSILDSENTNNCLKQTLQIASQCWNNIIR